MTSITGYPSPSLKQAAKDAFRSNSEDQHAKLQAANAAILAHAMAHTPVRIPVQGFSLQQPSPDGIARHLASLSLND
jgi:hypothetical protein